MVVCVERTGKFEKASERIVLCCFSFRKRSELALFFLPSTAALCQNFLTQRKDLCSPLPVRHFSITAPLVSAFQSPQNHCKQRRVRKELSRYVVSSTTSHSRIVDQPFLPLSTPFKDLSYTSQIVPAYFVRLRSHSTTCRLSTNS